MFVENIIFNPVQSGRDAIACHVRWKITLQMAITMREPLSERATFAARYWNECAIGKWLLSIEGTHLRATLEYLAARKLHEDTHREMYKIVILINDAEYANAERCLGPASPFHKTSMAMMNAITALSAISEIRPADSKPLRPLLK